MGKRDEQRKVKLCILQKIKERKAILFGTFSNSLTNKDKMQAWKEVSAYAQALGVIPEGKDITYLRDVWWPNVRKSTMEKQGNARKTGTGGGPNAKLSEVDCEVLEIVGKDPPAVAGLNISESLEDSTEYILNLEAHETEEVTKVSTISNTSIPYTSSSTTSNSSKHQNVDQPALNVPSSAEARESLIRIRKLELSVEIMEKESYYRSLQILQLERELGLCPSKFTDAFPKLEQLYVIQDGDVNEGLKE